MRETAFSLAAAAALVALAAVGCADPRYCDVDTPCKDQAYPYCDTVLHECEAFQTDAGVDAAHDDGGPPDGQADAQTDAPIVPDGGCEAPQRECAGFCYDLDDPAHCGDSCLECTVPTNGAATCDGTSCGIQCDQSYYPLDGACEACAVAEHCGPTCVACSAADQPDCSGQSGACVCNAASCGGLTPVCDSGTGACRACQAHRECPSGACDPGGGCVAVADVIFVDQNDASCTDTGASAGLPASPYCTFPPALTKALAGPKITIVIKAGSYSFTADNYIQDKTVVIIGAGAATTELVQTKNNRSVLWLKEQATVRVEDLTLRGGAGNDGHGLKCACVSGHGTLTVRRCIIRNNEHLGIDSSQCDVTMTQSIVRTNAGGGVHLYISSHTLVNNLIANNGAAASTTGGVNIDLPGTPALFINNTVAYNTCVSGTASGVQCSVTSPASVVNSILWFNSVSQYANCTVDYSDVQGGTNGGTGNLAADPLFVDATSGNYKLSTSPTVSPAINAGTVANAPTVDLEGQARANTPDLGCYEAQ
jgi:hypothetical protein